MFIRRTAAASLAAALTFGGASVAHAADTTTTTTDPSAPITEPVAPVIDSFMLNLPGLGAIDVSVDTTTGEIQTILVTPVDGVTASDPTVVNGGVQIDFTLADGTIRSILVSAETEHGRIEIEIEIEDPSFDDSDDDHGDGPPDVSDRGESEDHRNDGDHRNGHSLGDDDDSADDDEDDAPDVTVPTDTIDDSGRGSDRSGSDHVDDSDDDDDDSESGRRD